MFNFHIKVGVIKIYYRVECLGVYTAYAGEAFENINKVNENGHAMK